MRKLSKTTLAFLVSTILLSSALAVVLFTKSLTFTASIKTTSGLATYAYGTTTPTSGFGFGEYDVSLGDVTVQFEFAVKNVGNVPCVLTYSLQNAIGWTFDATGKWYQRKVSTVLVWEINVWHYSGLPNFIPETATYTPDANYVKQLSLAIGETVNLKMTLKAFQQSTIVESLSFIIDLKANSV